MNRALLAIWMLAMALGPLVAHADQIFVFEGHTYKIISQPATWHAASSAAAKMQLAGHTGYLVRIDSDRENRAVLEAVSSHLTKSQLARTLADDGSNAPFIWLGGSDAEREGEWVWSNNGDPFWSGDFNGSPISGRYTNWGVQPDSASGSEDGLAMGLNDWPEPFYDLGSSGQWNDLDTNTALSYVVEFDGKTDLRLVVEEPVVGGTHSGIGLIRGWAVSSNDIERVQVFLDKEYLFDIPYGGKRSDVGSVLTEVAGSENSGFASAFNYSSLGKGEHELRLRAIDNFGSTLERVVRFEVTRFVSEFIQKGDAVELGWSGVIGMGDSLIIRDALIDGDYYNIILKWRTSSQKFELDYIEKK
jgi:hypothetical protein